MMHRRLSMRMRNTGIAYRSKKDTELVKVTGVIEKTYILSFIMINDKRDWEGVHANGYIDKW